MRVSGAVLSALLFTTGCSGEPAPERPAAATPSPSIPGEYGSLEEIAAAFGCEDVQDVGTGGNPGLTAFGVCHIGRHNIDIYMTSSVVQWEHIAEQFPSVVGESWIIVCPTGAKAARIVHERLGGDLRIPGDD